MGYNMGGLGGQDVMVRADAACRQEGTQGPLEGNLTALAATLSLLENRISDLKEKLYPIRTQQAISPTNKAPPNSNVEHLPSYGSSPLCNSISSATTRVHNAAAEIAELFNDLEV